MTMGERLILYVAQQIEDKGASPTLTKILKIIYLIDVEYFRRHRKTLTDWNWVFYKYGPYVFEYPALLEKIGLAGYADTEEGRYQGQSFSAVRPFGNVKLDDVLPTSDTLFINRIIKQWATEPLGHLLDYVYFDTEPMQGAQKQEPLEFEKIPAKTYEPMVEWDKLAPSQELKQLIKAELAELRKRKKTTRIEIGALLEDAPLVKDRDYAIAMKETREENIVDFGDITTVEASE